MDPKDKVFSQFTREEMEKKMENYCVLLPFPVNAANGTDSQDADRTQLIGMLSKPWVSKIG